MPVQAQLESLCKLFLMNRDRVKAGFGWENSYVYPICAAILADKGQLADTARLRQCRDLIKAQTGIFSNFRTAVKLPAICMLSLDENPDEKLRRVLRVYGLLRGQFSSSPYLPLAAMAIGGIAEEAEYEPLAARTRAIYKRMRAEHPFLTSGEDSVFAALLALSPMTEDMIVGETEACYRLMKTRFFSGDAVQSLSHALALGEGNAEEKCEKTMRLYEALKQRGMRYGTGCELATLGALALLPAREEELADEIGEVSEFLSMQRGYGFFGPGKKQRLMHAGMLVTSHRIGLSAASPYAGAAISGVISLIAAQQVAICAAIAASSAASSASG